MATHESDPRLDLITPLTPADAVAAILIADGRYLLQRRDLKRGIFFPGCWGCFGGGIDEGESEQHALIRELDEELGWTPPAESIRFFSRFDFDLRFAGRGSIYRAFYEVDASSVDPTRLQLGEGSAMKLFPPQAILDASITLTPYDNFAVWLHINRTRLMLRHGPDQAPR